MSTIFLFIYSFIYSFLFSEKPDISQERRESLMNNRQSLDAWLFGGGQAGFHSHLSPHQEDAAAALCDTSEQWKASYKPCIRKSGGPP